MKKSINISINNLILYNLWLILQKKESCNFEKLVKECFDNFPDSFSLTLYKLPDSRKLDRPLRFMKKNKLLKVDKKNNFSLTKTGIKKAQEINNILRQEKLNI